MVLRRLILVAVVLAIVLRPSFAQDLPPITDHKTMAMQAKARRNPLDRQAFEILAEEARAGNPDAVTALIELIREPETRWFSSFELSNIGPPAAPFLPALLSLMQEFRGDVTCSSIVHAIGKIGPAAEPAVAPLVGVIRDPKHCAAVAESLAQIGESPGVALPALAWAIDNGDFDCQIKAIRAVGSFPYSSSVEILTEILDTRDGYFLVVAVETLGRLGPLAAPAEEKIAPFVESESLQLRSASELALTRIRGYGSGEDNDRQVRQAIQSIAQEWYAANRNDLSFSGVCVSKEPAGGVFRVSAMIETNGTYSDVLRRGSEARARLAVELRPLIEFLHLRGFTTEIDPSPCHGFAVPAR